MRKWLIVIIGLLLLTSCKSRHRTVERDRTITEVEKVINVQHEINTVTVDTSISYEVSIIPIDTLKEASIIIDNKPIKLNNAKAVIKVEEKKTKKIENVKKDKTITTNIDIKKDVKNTEVKSKPKVGFAILGIVFIIVIAIGVVWIRQKFKKTL